MFYIGIHTLARIHFSTFTSHTTKRKKRTGKIFFSFFSIFQTEKKKIRIHTHSQIQFFLHIFTDMLYMYTRAEKCIYFLCNICTEKKYKRKSWAPSSFYFYTIFIYLFFFSILYFRVINIYRDIQLYQ